MDVLQPPAPPAAEAKSDAPWANWRSWGHETKLKLREHLFPKIKALQPALAGRITSLVLKMREGQLVALLEDEGALLDKVDECMLEIAHADSMDVAS